MVLASGNQYIYCPLCQNIGYHFNQEFPINLKIVSILRKIKKDEQYLKETYEHDLLSQDFSTMNLNRSMVTPHRTSTPGLLNATTLPYFSHQNPSC